VKKFTLTTDKEAFYNITAEVRRAVEESGVRDGLCVVYCPHTTAAVTVNENADPDVARDVMLGMKSFFPKLSCYRHGEGNSDGHLKSTLAGASLSLIIDNGKLVLGEWQDIYFLEFDPPRNRQYYVQIIGE